MGRGNYQPPPNRFARDVIVKTGDVVGSDLEEDTLVRLESSRARLIVDGSTRVDATPSYVLVSAEDEFRVNVGGARGLTVLDGGGTVLRFPVQSIEPDQNLIQVTENQCFLLVDTGGGAVTIRLPDPAIVSGRQFIIKHDGQTSGSITITAGGGGEIDRGASFTLDDAYSAISVQSDGSGYWIF